MANTREKMPFTGKLEERSLPVLLHYLSISKKTGHLKLVHGDQAKIISLAKGVPVIARSNVATDSLGHHLKERGLITDALLKQGAERAKLTGKDEGTVFIELGAVSPNALFEAISEHQRLLAVRCFVWGTGEFLFQELPSLPAETVPIKQSVPRLILDGIFAHFDADRMGDLLRLPRSAAPVMNPDAPYGVADLSLSKSEREIFHLVSSELTIVDICDRAESRRQAYALLFALQCMQVIGFAENPATVSETPRDPLEDPQYRVRVSVPAKPVVESVPPGSPTGSVPPRPPSASRSRPPARVPSSLPPKRTSAGPGSPAPEGAAADAKTSHVEIDLRAPGGENYKKGTHYLGMREYVLASKAFKQAMREDPDQPIYQAYYGWALFALSPEENTDEALQHIRAALTVQPKWAKGHFFLGRIHALNGKHDLAIKSFQAAISARPNYPDAKAELTKCQAAASGPAERPSFTDRLVGWTKKK